MRIAHVGHTKTLEDLTRIIKVVTWCLDNGYNPKKGTNDYIELQHGRDFLIEKETYDIVILHFLFRGGFAVAPARLQCKELAYSPHASWASWRRRLVATRAKLIFAFGGSTEVSGSYLVDLPGYKSFHEDQFSVFTLEIPS